MANANWIDVSYFQDPNKFDYQAAKQAGIQGLIIRAGYGKTQDTAAAQHIANAQKYGFMWHLYHYWYNMGGEAEWAVQNAKSLGLTANQYLFLDMEDKSLPADWNGQFAVFRKAVGDAYKVGLYCSDSPYKAKFQDSQLQQLKVARWIASYSYEPVNYDIWQLSGAGSGGFGSYTGDVDRDYTKSDILSLYATTNINPVVTKPTADLQYIQPIMLQPGYDTETNIYGLGYSPDNGVHFYVTYTTFGAKYRQEDADRLWKYLQGFVTKQIHDAVSLTWDNIKGKPDLVLRSDLPDFNQFALKKDLPAPVDLSGYALKSELPSLDGYAKLTDIPSLTGLVRETELAPYAKKSDLPDVSGLAKSTTVDAVKATAENALNSADKAQSTAEANSKALADKVNRDELPVVPTDLVHTAEMEQVKADITQAKQMANDAVILANNAKVTINTDDEFKVKKPSEYSGGFSHELKRVAAMIPDRSSLAESAQADTIAVLSTMSYGGYARQTLKVLDSPRPMTFIRNGSGDIWYPWETVTTTITVD